MILKDVHSWLKSLGEIRDGLLLLVSATYVVGFISWSLYAWRLGVGAVPALDAQYFVAGTPIAVVIVLTTGLVLATARLIARAWHHEDGRFRSTIKYAVIAAALIVFFGTIIAYGFIKFRAWRADLNARRISDLSDFSPRFIITEAVLGLIIWHIMNNFDEIIELFSEWMALWRLLFVVSIVAISAGVIYVFVVFVYPSFPDALGGGRPRRAQVDLKIESVSAETLAVLVARPSVQGAKVARTREVWVLQMRDHLLLFAHEPTIASPRFELPRSAAETIVWQNE